MEIIRFVPWFLTLLSTFSILLLINLPYYSPSVYHVYIPSFKRTLSLNDKENTELEKKSCQRQLKRCN
jgi:hypothetical protein